MHGPTSHAVQQPSSHGFWKMPVLGRGAQSAWRDTNVSLVGGLKRRAQRLEGIEPTRWLLSRSTSAMQKTVEIDYQWEHRITCYQSQKYINERNLLILDRPPSRTAGIDPVNKLPSNQMSCNVVLLPQFDGIGPVIVLFDRYKLTKFGRLKMTGAIVEPNEFSAQSRNLRVGLENSGTAPINWFCDNNTFAIIARNIQTMIFWWEIAEKSTSMNYRWQWTIKLHSLTNSLSFWKLPKLVGILPVNWFSERKISTKLERLLNDDGIDPVSPSWSSIRFLSNVILPILDGIVPARLLFEMSMLTMLVKAPMLSGMIPVNKLLYK